VSSKLALLSDRFNTLRFEDGKVVILDRRKYPHSVEFVTCQTVEEVAEAIEMMVVQGAPPLAYVAGYGLVLAAKQSSGKRPEVIRKAMSESAERLRRTRPTGGDIFILLDEALEVADRTISEGGDPADAVLAYVDGQVEGGNRIARDCGRYAAEVLDDGDIILTHCFAGAALNYMLYFAQEAGKHIELIATETRPYLQGARLTCASAREQGVPVTLVTDNMPAYLMWRGMITKLITAADKITFDGYVTNKIGTYMYALAAHAHSVPFYVLGYDGPDPRSPSVDSIEIEERDPEEVFYCLGVRTAAEGIKGYYPAFDITPPNLIEGIVTDKGVYPPRLVKRYFED